MAEPSLSLTEVMRLLDRAVKNGEDHYPDDADYAMQIASSYVFGFLKGWVEQQQQPVIPHIPAYRVVCIAAGVNKTVGVFDTPVRAMHEAEVRAASDGLTQVHSATGEELASYDRRGLRWAKAGMMQGEARS